MLEPQPQSDNASSFARLWTITQELRQKLEASFELQADPRLSSFTSKSLYIRQFQSPVSLCYTCMATEETLELIRRVSHEMLDRWLTWVQEAEPVAAEAQIALRDRDLLIRRTSAERDPGNKLAMQMFGTELTEKLIEALWRRQ